eukprot:319163-Heterocapsa_arctica.AAC.1
MSRSAPRASSRWVTPCWLATLRARGEQLQEPGFAPDEQSAEGRASPNALAQCSDLQFGVR